MTLTDLWAVMKSMYPHAFKEFGPVGGPVFRYWETDLAGVDLEIGFRALRVRTSEFPPSLPEFKRMCGQLSLLPENDEDMRRWAMENGYGDARPMESWKQYRARIKAVAERERQAALLETGQRKLT